MATEVTQSESFYKAWAWFETNKKQVGWGASILVVAGLVIWFFLWQQKEKEVNAGEALSHVSTPHLGAAGARPDTADAYLKVVAEYPKSSAAERGLLLAAGSYFIDGKYDQAKAQFEKFLREHRGSRFTGQVLLGIGACLDAQGKSDDAIKAYKDLVDHYPREHATPQAKFALGRLYEAQGKQEEAFGLFEDLVKTEPYGTLGSEAGMRAEELKVKNPKLAINTNLPAANVMPTPPVLEQALSNAAPGTSVVVPQQPGATAPSPSPGTSTPAPQTTTNIVPLFAPSNNASALTVTNPAPPSGATSAPPQQ